MYHLLTSVYQEWTRKKQFNILVLGQGSVGKSSLLECIKSQYNQTPSLSIDRISKTVGQNVLDVPISEISTILHFWDLGGEAPLRRLWEQYYKEAQMLIWVVDGNDWKDQEGEAEEKEKEKLERRNSDWDLLASVLSKHSMKDIPLLLVLNKLDSLPTESSSTSSDLSSYVAWFEARLGKSLPNKAPRSTMNVYPTIAKEDSTESTTKEQLESRSWELVEASALKKSGIKSIVDSLISFAR